MLMEEKILSNGKYQTNISMLSWTQVAVISTIAKPVWANKAMYQHENNKLWWARPVPHDTPAEVLHTCNSVLHVQVCEIHKP